jgi:hypothetical protein
MASRSTALLLVAIPWVLGLIDLWLYVRLGNAATFSWVMLTTAARHSSVPYAMAYTFGVLQGHFFLPAHGEAAPPGYVAVARLVAALAPVLYAMILIAFNADDAVRLRPATPDEQGWLAAKLLAFTAAGLFVGRLVLPQHPE